ncbi:MAG: hypothetical protein D6702_01745 [Planctomycetota bacterium]|nr:MAG: hypothetical protein D6702_01745 [Planctomycetota bacterium]
MTSTIDHRRGSALLIVVILGTLAMALWGAAYRATHDSFTVENFYRLRQEREELTSAAVVRAGNLLRTGRPPKERCFYVTELDSGWARVEFERSGASTTWRVEATRATAADRRRYPILPDSFAGGDGWGPKKKKEEKEKKKDKKKD